MSKMEEYSLRITGADPAACLDALVSRGITVRNIGWENEITLRLSISGKDYPAVMRICETRGDEVKILRKQGAGLHLARLKDRPLLIAAMVIMVLLTVLLPSRVLFVRVEGNRHVATNYILEQAAQCGIGFGVSRRGVRSEKVKNALLDRIPELQWAGVNTSGCVATISVREKNPETQQSQNEGFGNVVALRSGIITDCTALRGSLLCAPGQAVTEGEVLISGYTDCGLTIRAEQAEGEVYARTARQLQAVILNSVVVQGENQEAKQKISLLIGKKRIFLWKDSGIWDTTCDRMYEEYYVTLPGGFQLPIALSVETFRMRLSYPDILETEEARKILSEFAFSYLRDQMVAGEVHDSQLTFSQEDTCVRMSGKYICTEMIGKLQRQQIGELDGQENGKNGERRTG